MGRTRIAGYVGRTRIARYVGRTRIAGFLRPVIDVLEHGRLAPRGSGAQGTAAVVGERHGHRERPAVIHDVVLDKTARRTLLLRGIGPAHAIRVHGIRGNDLAHGVCKLARTRDDPVLIDPSGIRQVLSRITQGRECDVAALVVRDRLQDRTVRIHQLEGEFTIL